MIARLLPALLALFLCLPATLARADSPSAAFTNTVTLTDDVGDYPLGKHLAILEDPTGTLSFEDVSSEARASSFVPSTKDVPGFGFTRSAYWVKVDIDRRTTRENGWMLEFGYGPMQWIDVYVQTSDGRVTHLKGGAEVPTSKRPYAYHTHVFPVDLVPDKVTHVYVKTTTEGSQNLPLRLYRTDAFAQRSTGEIAVLALYAGIITALFFYNAFVYYAMRERSYLYYMGSLLSISISIMSIRGISQELLSDHAPQLCNRMIAIGIGCSNIFAGFFTVSFLDSRHSLPRLHWVMVASIVGGFITLLLAAFSTYHLSVIVGASISAIHCFVAFTGACLAVKQGSRHARYYVLAWTMLLCGIVLLVLRTFGILPTNTFTENSFLWGSAAESILLSIALSARMRTMKDEKEHAQAATLSAQQEALTNKQLALDTIQKYSIKLEDEVKTRTAELIDTQKKLIATEKMAALGVFTAGMAHEINNPANFISVGAQNTAAQISVLKSFVTDLLSDDADADISQAFDQHFRKLDASNTTVIEGVSRIEHVVKQLRAAHPEGEVGYQPADVVATLESAWQILAPTLKSPVELLTTFEARPSVPCAIAELQQVFLALLGNAAHAIEDATAVHNGNYAGQITLTSHADAQRLILTISDNGIGMSADTLGKMFDAFYTTKSVGRGAGLGLSMARDIITQHRGTIEATSTEGAGSTLIIALPLAWSLAIDRICLPH